MGGTQKKQNMISFLCRPGITITILKLYAEQTGTIHTFIILRMTQLEIKPMVFHTESECSSTKHHQWVKKWSLFENNRY